MQILWRAGSEAVLCKLEVGWQTLACMGMVLRLRQSGSESPRMNNPYVGMEIMPWSGQSMLGLPIWQDSPNGSMSVC